MLGLFLGDENSTHQTGQVTYHFHLPVSFDTRIGEWASTCVNNITAQPMVRFETANNIMAQLTRDISIVN